MNVFTRLLPLAALTVLIGCQAQSKSASCKLTGPDRQFRTMKYGIFVHHVWSDKYKEGIDPDGATSATIDEFVNKFDVERFVNDLKTFDPEYLVFTLWHLEMNPLFPSKVMDKWRGPGHASSRDLIGELITALEPTGIKFVAYFHPSDGHDFTEEDQAKLGWNQGWKKGESTGYVEGKFGPWNEFMDEFCAEFSERYGDAFIGYWVDGGWERVDKRRLQATIWKYNPKGEFLSGMDNATWCDHFNHLVPPDPNKGIPKADFGNVETWPSFYSGVNLITGSMWNAKGGCAMISPTDMARYTILQAATNTRGGGVGWSAGTYSDASWEMNVREYLTMLGQLLKPISESVKNTYSSNSYVTKQGSRIATLPGGFVATTSADDKYEYIHFLKPPLWKGLHRLGFFSGNRTIILPPPADFQTFGKATMLRSGRPVTLTQDEKGVSLEIPWQDCWDPIDTVVKIERLAGNDQLARGILPTMSGEKRPPNFLRLATDGNKNGDAWESSHIEAGEAAWIGFDLGLQADITRLHLYPQIKDKLVGYGFPVDLTIAVSEDGTNFTTVLIVNDYKIDASRSEEGQAKQLSATGKLDASDFPQYFKLPEGTKGRHLRISATKVNGGTTMRLGEVEVYGSRK